MNEDDPYEGQERLIDLIKTIELALPSDFRSEDFINAFCVICAKRLIQNVKLTKQAAAIDGLVEIIKDKITDIVKMLRTLQNNKMN